ncbi:MAG: methyltransferase domain-containing protein [Myxococcota bacterium]|nr:methyltransferase domain-containing protein [Deltaproteobacteria bacterium]MDQ3337724.1 methyltransferase domain-containing protein [Myxococcota bacterium]
MNPALAYHEYLGPAIFRPCAELALALANIQPHEHVLDVACGTGIVTSLVRAARVVGIDLSPGMLEVAMRTPGVEWLQGSALALPLPDATFDVVLCQQGMQFFKDRAAAARELRRVCTGRAVVACWQSFEQQSFFAGVVRSQAKHLGATIEDAGKPFTFGDGTALGALLRDAGFARVDVQAHAIETRFPDPPQFVRMCVASALAVMPERFGSVDPEPFISAVVADVQDEMRRFTVGDHLQFTMKTNTAVAFV